MGWTDLSIGGPYMRYWITTHWPRRENEGPSRLSGIWLPDGRHAPGARIAPGDLVAIYESKTGRTLVQQTAKGGMSRIRCRKGRQGVIAIGRVTAEVAADPAARVEKYSDGSKIWWRWHAPVEVVATTGLLERPALLPLLGYKPNYNLHGFGEQSSGLKELSESEFTAVCEAFAGAHPITNPASIIMPGKGKVPGAGESDAHLHLKQFVASNPAYALKEPGLTTLLIEYPFPTGDRADIALVDAFNRVVGVEVEPDVGDADAVGPLQAIKYRWMLEWTCKRNPHDSRAVLVAYSISPAMVEQCHKYGVECHVVPKSAVEEWLGAQTH